MTPLDVLVWVGVIALAVVFAAIAGLILFVAVISSLREVQRYRDRSRL